MKTTHIHGIMTAVVMCLSIQVHGEPPEKPSVEKGNGSIPESTLSPDGRYGVTVPNVQQYDAALLAEEKTKVPTYLNKLVEARSGRVLEVIKAENGMEHMNHGGIGPHWAKDSSALLWVVGGKWFPRATVYLKLADGKVAWQTDILTKAQQEMLRRTRAAIPKAYAAAVRQNKGSGSAYPDGFTIDIDVPSENPVLPLRFSTNLTANPKNADWFPVDAEVYAKMNGVLEKDGSITWSGFRFWSGAEARKRAGEN